MLVMSGEYGVMDNYYANTDTTHGPNSHDHVFS